MPSFAQCHGWLLCVLKLKALNLSIVDIDKVLDTVDLWRCNMICEPLGALMHLHLQPLQFLGYRAAMIAKTLET